MIKTDNDKTKKTKTDKTSAKRLLSKTYNEGSVSGRTLYGNYDLGPVYDSSVLVGKESNIYGSTFFAPSVFEGNTTIRAYGKGQVLKDTVNVPYSHVGSTDLKYYSPNRGNSPTINESATTLQFMWSSLNYSLILSLKLDTGNIVGLNEIEVNGVPIRESSASVCGFKIEEINGTHLSTVDYNTCEYTGYETAGEIAIVHSKLDTTGGDTYVDWIFKPWQYSVEGTDYKGLGYRFYVSSLIDISTFQVSSSWELWGSAHIKKSGTTLFSRRDGYWWKTIISGSWTDTLLSYSFMNQPPEYMYDSSGSLSSYIFPPAMLENTFKEVKHEALIWQYDTFDLGETKKSDIPFRIVMYSPTGGIDKYTYLFDKISADYRNFYGIEEVTPLPTAELGGIFTFNPNLDYGNPYEYDYFVSNYLPDLIDYNFKSLNTAANFLLNDDRLGSPYSTHRLTNHDLRFHPDDETDIDEMLTAVHAEGLKFNLWVSLCFSVSSNLYSYDAEHGNLPPNTVDYEWRIMDVDGDYPQPASKKCWVMSTRSGYLAYALNKLQILYNEFPFDGIWHDSFEAASRTDYGDITIRPSVDQMFQFLSFTQSIGFEPHTEAICSVALPALNINNTNPNSITNLSYSFNSGCRLGCEYLAYKTNFLATTPTIYYPSGYFRLIANKAPPMIGFFSITEDWQLAEVSSANYDYNQVYTFMDKRHVLQDSNGILWYGGIDRSSQILFSYHKHTYTLNDEINKAYDITGRLNVTDAIDTGTLPVSANHTYKLDI